MKSSFLLLLVLFSSLSLEVWGQTVKKKVIVKKSQSVSKPQVTPGPKAEEKPVLTLEEKTASQKFYDRLSIGYFGAFTSPTLEDWDSRYAALSPEFSDGTNQDTYSMNLWSQVNFGYNYGGKLKFNILPRFTIFMNEAPTQDPGERGNFLLEDMLVGFSGVIYSSDDKKFNWWIRPGVRLPTSHASRHYNHPDFGQITSQFEHLHSFTYDFNPTIQVGLTVQDRYWIFEQRYNGSRHRIYSAPFFVYTLNDTTKIQAYYEHMMENNKKWKSINGQKPNYQNVWQNAYIGVAKDITPKLNVYPYLSAFVNDVPFSTKSMFLGAWISYSIK